MPELNAPESAGTSSISPGLAVGLAIGFAAGRLIARRPGIDPSLKKASLLPYAADIYSELPVDCTGLIVGGLPIDVFNHEGTEVDAGTETMAADSSFESLLLRGNNTVRDFDVLTYRRDSLGRLVRIDDEEQEQLKVKMENSAKNRANGLGQPAPPISVFSFDKKPSLIHSATILGQEGLYLEQGFVRQILPEDSMRPWTQILPDGTAINVLNPWEQYYRSVVRFSSGVKVKDIEKLDKMREKLRSIPGLAELEDSDVPRAYQSFYERMIAQNSFSSVVESARWETFDLSRTISLGQLAVSARALHWGQRIPAVARLVQATPQVFNMFVGSK